MMDMEERKGVCSSYLAERVGEKIPYYLHPNKNFKLPEDSSTPIIMVGPAGILFVLLLRNGEREHRAEIGSF